DRARQPPLRAGGHRGNRRRRDHGCDAQDAAGAWRAIPPGEHRIRAWPCAAPELSETCTHGFARRRSMSKPDGEFATLLKRVAAGEHLSAAEASSAFGAMMAGAVSDVRMASFLTALALRGPTISEITGAARAMREAMTVVQAPPHTIDVCGTGGDGA